MRAAAAPAANGYLFTCFRIPRKKAWTSGVFLVELHPRNQGIPRHFRN
jgi:hypothetical protein